MSDLSRRAFVVSSLTTGFALAVRPVSAQTITTDASGLVAGEVTIGSMPAYSAKPEGKGPFPLVLVVHEIFGVHEHIKDVCRRLAKAGYHAVAPELFARQGDVSKMTDIPKILELVGTVPDGQVFADLDATIAWAKADKVAITGFCWGGRIVWLYAARSPKPKAGVAWYGRLSHAQNTLQPKSPLDIAAQLKAPVLGLYGGKDTGIPLAHLEIMGRDLKPPSAFVVYPDAGHAFNADYRPSYVKSAADDGWARMLAFFKQQGV